MDGRDERLSKILQLTPKLTFSESNHEGLKKNQGTSQKVDNRTMQLVEQENVNHSKTILKSEIKPSRGNKVQCSETKL